MVRQDELNLVVDILNSINVGITGRALVVPDTYRAHALALQKDIEWTTSDNPPTSRSGVIFVCYYFNYYYFLMYFFPIGDCS